MGPDPVHVAQRAERVVHPTAIIDPGAELGPGVRVEAYAVIRDHVTIGEGTWIGPHAVIEEWTTLGRDCRVYAGAVLGGIPQDRHFKGERSYLTIGDRVVLREYVTISRATGEEAATVIGDDTQMLAFSHAGHNCRFGRGVIITNTCQISGHAVIGDRTQLGGMVGVIQFARIGTLVMVAGMAGINKDVPPYMLVNENPTRLAMINRVGLERAGVPEDVQAALRRAHRILVRSGLDVSRAVDRIEAELGEWPEVRHLVEFIRDSQARGIGIHR